MADLAERPQRLLKLDAELFGKLTPGGRLGLLVVGVFSLGNGPGAEIALAARTGRRDERAETRMPSTARLYIKMPALFRTAMRQRLARIRLAIKETSRFQLFQNRSSTLRGVGGALI